MSSSHSTPSKVASEKGGLKSKASSSSRSSSNKFTPAMQERQARNKDPYSSSDESSDSAWEGQNKRFDNYGKDSVLKTQRRREAAIVLDNPELLMMHAQARFDSIPGTRHYYTKILCGFEDEHDSYRDMLRNRQAEKTDREPAKEPTKAKRGP